MIRRAVAWVWLLLCCGFLAVGTGVAAAASERAVGAEIRVLVGASERAPSQPVIDDALVRIYRAADDAPLWLGAGGGSPPAAQALALLADAPSHGLDPSDYLSAELRSAVDVVAAGSATPRQAARADVALTRAMLRYLHDLDAGRVAPEAAGFRMRPRTGAFDAATHLQHALASGRLPDAVAAAEPSLVLYARLKTALAQYRALRDLPWPPLPLPAGTQKVVPGERYAAVDALAQRLRVLGDLPAGAALAGEDRYDGAVVDALRRFQARHGLAVDGVLGAQTLHALATPPAVRVRQIELALERLRWLPPLPPGPLIAVNVPSYTLWAFASGNGRVAPVLAMPVIVGRATRAMQTPAFIGEMRYVEFSPYWNVPPGIARNEIVPKLARDPSWLLREDMEIVGARDALPATGEVDAATLEGIAAGALRVRQRPGPKNALGGVKFALPNTMDIYLHGTPAQELFGRARRDFSHGCIRVADPPALARFVLASRPEWTAERMREAMGADKPVVVSLPDPIPVVIFYTTVVVGEDGRVQFLPDVYGYDERLLRALRARTPDAD